MADPLRRTLLAKLRGKNPKKATAFGDHREGTEDAGISEFAKTSDLLNAAAVSKRNHGLWQTSRKDHAVDEDLVCFRFKEGYGSHIAKTDGLLPSPLIFVSSEAQHPYLDTLTLQPHFPQLRIDSLDRHNDMDGEGEIWYNPIPEDDSPEPAWTLESPVTVVPSGGDIEEVCRPHMSNLQDYLDGRAHDVSCGNTVCSMEPIKNCRQNPLPRTTTPDATEVAFSHPSSPSCSKKAGSISWSFPDKIKSPRTMRKLSMKMKRLPELGRKLSVKRASSSGHSQSEPRQSSPKANPRVEVGQSLLAVHGQMAASRNVISRYHLDSSVSTQHDYSQKTGNCSKSASKGGYLSDGDSPELVIKSGKRRLQWKAGRRKESSASNSPRRHGVEMDFEAFHHYNFIEQSKCNQFISGLMSLHLCGAKDLKSSYVDSHSIYCAIQVDLVNKARTAVLTCRTTFLDMDHTFHIQLEEAQRLTLVVFSWESDLQRHRVCCHGTVSLPELFQVTGPHRLAVRLEPRGIIYVKLSLMEQQQSSLDGPDREFDPQLFGVDANHVVEQENTGSLVPLIIEKCISEIERRGCQVTRACGIYILHI